MYRVPAAITMANASAALAGIVGAIDAGDVDLALDALAHSDSSSVAVLIAAVRHARVAGRPLRLSGMPASVASLAKLYGVDALFAASVEPSVAADAAVVAAPVAASFPASTATSRSVPASTFPAA